MDILTKANLRELLAQTRTPCVSLYLPTHRGGSEQDPIRAKNGLTAIEDALSKTALSPREIKRLLRPARSLFAEESFWKSQSDGLACFLAPAFARFFRLPIPFAEATLVASHFQLKPLLPLLSGDGRFYVLAISQKQVRLLQGSEQRVDRIDLAGVPTSLAEVLRFSDRDQPVRYQLRGPGGGHWGGAFHGEALGTVEIKKDLLDYFQQVDRGLHDLLRSDNAPLLLASVAHLWPIYRQANRYPHLLEQGIAGNPDHLSDQELHQRAWAIVRPHFQEAQRNAAALYHQLAGTGRTTTDIAETVAAACQGRLEFLFVALGKEQWGTCAPIGTDIDLHATKRPGDEDLLNLAAFHTILRGGVVYATNDVPGGGPVAGIYWLPLAKRK